MALYFTTKYPEKVAAMFGSDGREYVPQQLLTHLPSHTILPSLPNT